MNADTIIINCIRELYFTSNTRSISSSIWEEAFQRLCTNGILKFNRYPEVSKYFWKNIFPKLESEHKMDRESIDRITYAKFLKVKGIKVEMKREGDDKKIDDAIFSEAETLVNYMRYDEFTLDRLITLQNLSRKMYIINVDDPRLNLPHRIKIKLVTPDVNESECEPVPEVNAPEKKTVSGIRRFASFEQKGKNVVLKLKGYNLHVIQKDGIQEVLGIPMSQDPLSSQSEPSIEEGQRSEVLMPPPSQPAPDTNEFLKIFNPRFTSTQDTQLSPIRGPSQENLKLNAPIKEQSFDLLSCSQATQQSTNLEGLIEPESFEASQQQLPLPDGQPQDITVQNPNFINPTTFEGENSNNTLDSVVAPDIFPKTAEPSLIGSTSKSQQKQAPKKTEENPKFPEPPPEFWAQIAMCKKNLRQKYPLLYPKSWESGSKEDYPVKEGQVPVEDEPMNSQDSNCSNEPLLKHKKYRKRKKIRKI